MTVRMIWAEARNRVIGADGDLPWHLPEDLRHFRDRTLGSTVVMGRATWASLPHQARPLPGRRNVVLSRTRGLDFAGAEVARSVAQVLETYDDFWVIGGARVYLAFAAHATQVVRTRIDVDVSGDSYAPALGPDWVRGTPGTETDWQTSRTGLRYAVEEFTRTVSR